jgi:hypothetical protein
MGVNYVLINQDKEYKGAMAIEKELLCTFLGSYESYRSRQILN